VIDIGEEREGHDLKIHSPLAFTLKYFRDGKLQRPWKLGDPSTVSFASEGR